MPRRVFFCVLSIQLALLLALIPSRAGESRLIYLAQPFRGKLAVLDVAQARIATTFSLGLGDVNIPFPPSGGESPLLFYSVGERAHRQWVTVLDQNNGRVLRVIELGTMPPGLNQKPCSWAFLGDKLIFLGNRNGLGTIFLVDRRTGDYSATDVNATISDAAFDGGDHLYVATRSEAGNTLRKYAGPTLDLAQNTPTEKPVGGLFLQGQELLALEFDSVSRVFASPMQIRRYNRNMAAISQPEYLGPLGGWFWQPELQVLVVAAGSYREPETNRPAPKLIVLGRNGQRALISSSSLAFVALDPSFSYAYTNGIGAEIVEVSLRDLTRRMAVQHGFSGHTGNERDAIIGFRPDYGGGSGITFYNDPGRVAVLDFTTWTNLEVACDTGAPFIWSLASMLFGPYEQSAVAYLRSQGMVVTFSTTAARINTFHFPDGRLLQSVPFRSRDVFFVRTGDDRILLLGTPGKWQILDPVDLGLHPFLADDGGANKDRVYMTRDPEPKTLLILRDDCCYVVNLPDLSVAAKIPLKYGKDHQLCVQPPFTL